MNNFQRKYGKYAINNLPLIMIMCYTVGYIIKYINSGVLNYLTLDPYKIVHGQVWRLFTWVIIPPNTSNIIFTLLMLFCVYSIASGIEHVIGTYQLNVFIFTGYLLTVASAFVLLPVIYLMYGGGMTEVVFGVYSLGFSTYYIYTSLFALFALSYPDARFLFMFIIPISGKWMVVLYIADFIFDFWFGNITIRCALVAALVNFLIFLLKTKRGRVTIPGSGIGKKMSFDKKRFTGRSAGNTVPFSQTQATENTARTRGVVTRHKCAVCGCTELDKPNMQFRFCSKCEGNYEYCEDHLYTHTHIKMS